MKLRIRHIVVLLCICFNAVWTIAQNDIDVSNYMFDEISYNPAFTGEGETFRASLLARKQWLGFEGSPLFQTLSIDGATKKMGGLGLHVVNDEIGFENNVTATLNYSYGVNLGKSSRLSLGFAVGIIDRFVDESEFVYQNQTMYDPYGFVDDNYIIPTLNVGLNLSIKSLTVGLSATHIANNLENSTIGALPRHFYGYAKYEINTKGCLQIVPSVLMKYGSQALQFEGNTNFYFNNKFWLGVSYRANESLVGLVGLIFKNRIYIGYSYDYNMNDISRYSSGSHEVFLSWRMKKDPKQKGFYQSTRLFN